jgi:hypothetical protein
MKQVGGEGRERRKGLAHLSTVWVPNCANPGPGTQITDERPANRHPTQPKP